MKEIWKDVVGYEGLYQVSNLGKIKSLSREYCHGNQYGVRTKKIDEKIMKQQITAFGYCSVKLSKNKVCKHFQVHRLVAEAFILNPNNYPVVNHKDINKQNNCVDNLEWCTQKYNVLHANQHGLFENRIRKLKKYIGQYDMEGNLIKLWDSARDAQKELKLKGYSNIRECCKGKRKTAYGFIWKEYDFEKGEII